METEANRIFEMLKNSWNGRMWHGTNLSEILKDIDHEKAFRKPAAGAHNIYELVMHMRCWRVFVLEHLQGHEGYKVIINSTVDWPTNYITGEASWKEALALLEESQRKLEEAFENFKDSNLDEAMHGRKFTWYVLMHGLIQHDIYHSAQISILKK